METILVHPENSSQLEALKAFLKALKIKFESGSKQDGEYNPEFVQKILEGQKEIEAGKGTTVKVENLWK